MLPTPTPPAVAKLPNPATQADPSIAQAGRTASIPGAAQFGNGTIMTSPGGLTSSASTTAGKTLLGQA